MVIWENWCGRVLEDIAVEIKGMMGQDRNERPRVR